MCSSRKYPYLPHRREFFKDHPTLLEIPSDLQKPTPPEENSTPSVGGVCIFSGTAQMYQSDKLFLET